MTKVNILGAGVVGTCIGRGVLQLEHEVARSMLWSLDLTKKRIDVRTPESYWAALTATVN
jgi:hypothetical protein